MPANTALFRGALDPNLKPQHMPPLVAPSLRDQALFVSSVVEYSRLSREKRWQTYSSLQGYHKALAAHNKPAPPPAPAASGADERHRDTRELLLHVEQLVMQLKAADPCATTGPADATAAERALVLDAPQQAYELQSSADMCQRSGHCGGTDAPRLAALLRQRLGEETARRERAAALQVRRQPHPNPPPPPSHSRLAVHRHSCRRCCSSSLPSAHRRRCSTRCACRPRSR